MALAFPTGSNNEKITRFNKTWLYDATIGAWRMDNVSGSNIADYEDVDLTGLSVGDFLVRSGSNWVGKDFTGVFTGSIQATSSVEVSTSQSFLAFKDNNELEVREELPDNLYAEYYDDGTSSYWKYYSTIEGTSVEKIIASASYAETASIASTFSENVSHYALDNFAENINIDRDRNIFMSMSRGVAGEYEVALYSASLDKYTTSKTVLGKEPNANGNVTIELNTVLTGSLLERPSASIDGTMYILQNETGSREGQNGVAFLYSEGPDDWFEITPPSQDAADERYVQTAGDELLANVKAFSLPVAGNEPATLGLAKTVIPTSDINLTAFSVVASSSFQVAYNTWVDLEYNEVLANDTGGTILDGEYTVPVTGVSRMNFSAGTRIRHDDNDRVQNNPRSYSIRLVKNDTIILAQNGHITNFRSGTNWYDEGLAVSSGIIDVAPGDRIKAQIKRTTSNRNVRFSAGIVGNNTGNVMNLNGGSFLSGVVQDTPAGTGVIGINGGDGITVTGNVETKTIVTDVTVLRTDIDQSLTAGQSISGDVNGTGSLLVSADLDIDNIIFSSSVFFSGDMQIDGLGNYTSDVQAQANGVGIGQPYRNGNMVLIRID